MKKDRAMENEDEKTAKLKAETLDIIEEMANVRKAYNSTMQGLIKLRDKKTSELNEMRNKKGGKKSNE